MHTWLLWFFFFLIDFFLKSCSFAIAFWICAKSVFNPFQTNNISLGLLIHSKKRVVFLASGCVYCIVEQAVSHHDETRCYAVLRWWDVQLDFCINHRRGLLGIYWDKLQTDYCRCLFVELVVYDISSHLVMILLMICIWIVILIWCVILYSWQIYFISLCM